MKKYECNACYNHCVLTTENDNGSLVCCFGRQNWHEVKEAVTDCNQLPDWCTVGEWVYDSVLRGYICVKKEEDSGFYVDHIASGRIKQARKRPFNAEEMKALVGKVIMDGDNVLFVSMYHGKEEFITAGCFVDFDRDDLKRCSCDGKPCYKLEHLENGEWVE